MNRIFGDGNPNNPEFFFQPFDAESREQEERGHYTPQPTAGAVEIEFTSKASLVEAYDKFLAKDPTAKPTAIELGTVMMFWYNHQLEHMDAGEQPCIPGSIAIITTGLALKALGYTAKKMGSKEEFRKGIFKVFIR